MRRFQKIILGAVPEQVKYVVLNIWEIPEPNNFFHYFKNSLPINICIERNIFKKHGIDVEHKIIPEGTGAMLDKLESGEIDVALTVTDGFIVGKANGRRVKMIGTFVKSPLVWAVAGCPKAKLTSFDMLHPDKLGKDCTFGVSRMGSGSHTMAFYAAKLYGINANAVKFKTANNFEGLKNGELIVNSLQLRLIF